jgi:hypothetical protein
MAEASARRWLEARAQLKYPRGQSAHSAANRKSACLQRVRSGQMCRDDGCPLRPLKAVRFTPESGHQKAKVAHWLCNLVHCCRAAIGAMASEPYCRSMLDRPSDEDVSRQILGVFIRHRIPATGTLQRNYFFEVRDGDFQRGINKAVANNWITIDLRNRYRYQLTTTGYAAGQVIDPVLGA